MSRIVDDSVLLSDSDDQAMPSGASSPEAILLSQQQGEDLVDSDDEDIFMGDIGIDEEDYEKGASPLKDLFGGAEADQEMFAGMKRGRGTRLLTVGAQKGGQVKEVGKKKNNAWTRPVRLSASLASFLGVEATPRTDVTKRVWAYIKEHNLQNPANKREILCDGKLQTVLGVTKVNMFSMTKILSKHMFKDDEVQYLEGDEEFGAAKRIKVGPAVKKEVEEWNVSGKKTKKDLQYERRVAGRLEGEGAAKSKLVDKGAALIAAERKKKEDAKKKKAEKKAKKAAAPKRVGSATPGSGFMKPLTLSPALSSLLGGEAALPRPTVVKKMWERIKEKGLQNPQDRREILCDAQMKAVFGTAKFTMFSMNKYLKAHLFAAEGEDKKAGVGSSSSSSSSSSSGGGGGGVKGEAEEKEEEWQDEEEEEEEEEEADL